MIIIMCAKIKFLAVVPESHKKKVIYKAFFFCKKSGHLLAIPVDKDVVDFLLRKRRLNIRDEEYCMACLLRCLKLNKIILIKNEKGYETIFKIKWLCWYKKIATPFYYGFMMSNLYKIPMEMEESTLNDEGILVTKDMLSEALIDSFGTYSKNPNANI